MKSLFALKQNKKGFMNIIMTILIAILVLVIVVIPLVATSITDLKNDATANLSSSNENMLDKIPTILVAVGVLIGVAAIVSIFGRGR